MGYFEIHPDVPQSPPFMEVGPSGLVLWLGGLAHSSRFDLRGVLPVSALCVASIHLGDPDAAVEALLREGIWSHVADGYLAENEGKWWRKRRTSAAYDPRAWEPHRESVYARDGHRCVYCGSGDTLSIDHVIPRTRGGSHDPSNLVTACRSCNSSKGARTPEEWIR